jgi:ribosomal-protein-alanine N-acetyltransferase
VRWASDQARVGAYHRFGIFLNEGSRIAGSASISGVQHGALWGASVGYWIGRSYAGSGLMPEALCLLLDYVFVDLSLHRAQISIMPSNRSSRRVVEKLGLRREGLLRDYLCIAGRWEDHEIYAILADEYRDRRDDLLARFVIPEGTAVGEFG